MNLIICCDILNEIYWEIQYYISSAENSDITV